jgi:hypothetical protein
VNLLTSLAGSLIERSIELYLAFTGGYITTQVPHKATWLSTEAIVHRHKSFLICLRFFISSTFSDYFMRYLYAIVHRHKSFLICLRFLYLVLLQTTLCAIYICLTKLLLSSIEAVVPRHTNFLICLLFFMPSISTDSIMR